MPAEIRIIPRIVKELFRRFIFIPKKNAGLAYGEVWLNTMKSFVEDTLNHIEEYFQGVNSENGWTQDKKVFG